MNATENIIFENTTLPPTLQGRNTPPFAEGRKKTESGRGRRREEVAQAVALYEANRRSITRMMKVLLMENDRIYLLAAIIFFALGKSI